MPQTKQDIEANRKERLRLIDEDEGTEPFQPCILGVIWPDSPLYLKYTCTDSDPRQPILVVDMGPNTPFRYDFEVLWNIRDKVWGKLPIGTMPMNRYRIFKLPISVEIPERAALEKTLKAATKKALENWQKRTSKLKQEVNQEADTALAVLNSSESRRSDLFAKFGVVTQLPSKNG